jgi:Spy/CpxP family protein refolding chaperone
MRKNLTIFFTAAALAVGVIYAQTAGPGPQGRRHGMQHRGPAAMAQHLNLTDAQKETAKAAFEQARQAAQPIQEQLKQNRQLLADAVKAGKSQAEIQQISANQGVLMGQLIAIRTEAQAKVYATLTPEQRQKADEMRERMRNRFGRGMGPRMGPGMGPGRAF